MTQLKCTLLKGGAEHGVVLGNTVKGHPSLFLLIAPPAVSHCLPQCQSKQSWLRAQCCALLLTLQSPE